MPVLSVFGSRTSTSLASRLVWPMAAILAGTLVLVIATMLWTSDGANEMAGERQRNQIANALAEEMSQAQRHLGELARSEDVAAAARETSAAARLHKVLCERGARLFGFDGVFVVTREGDFVTGFDDGAEVAQDGFAARLSLLQPTISDLEGRLRLTPAGEGPQDPPAAWISETGASQLVYDQGAAYAVVAVPVGQRLTAVAYLHLDQGFLDRLAARHSIGHLSIVTPPVAEGSVSLPLRDTRGRNVAFLAWEPERPGDLVRERFVPTILLVVLAAMIFSLLIFAHVQRVAVDLARSQDEAQRLAGHDPLSGLPNRLLFAERLDQELARIRRNGEGLAVMFLDLDRFKDVNDTYGHEAGDELIRLVARRLSDLLRGADTLSRFGGDEFSIIQTELKDARDAEALARRILDALTRPFELAAGPVTIGVSIGIALSPRNGIEREALMRLADTALYQAKNEGRNRYSFFERQMDEALRLRKIVEDDLRNAIANDGLTLHYQPQMSADGETIVGVEALVRWPHPRQGLITPNRFISVAEERGLIIPLGEWVLRRACEDAKRWPNLRVAVNVSAIQFRHRDFVRSVMRIVTESGIDPTRLELELTEGVVVDDADAAEEAMMELRALGIRLALDDFGTGYSSLIYLRRFAIDKIKIDRSFLESMETTGESAILVHSIVHLGRALGLTVTAEGVETREQHQFLQALGCHELQGYLFSKPVPAEEIDRMLAMASDEPKDTGGTAVA
ncbi:EAL domain-containing protein [Chelatococcus sp. SYSU_G07232]|uniref:EAL domain-containing protein n=1 Tax=Chelatococcus albus TaxID=3047466 RepID=A0ABT7AJC3_9HYPH|nr:EAL domain-containing protein [Chelatococcus sp. SYSU_G07232]MDJ1159480.1 EAL domain-containing protein [Chelatococcus sp. SYSU_G07232]